MHFSASNYCTRSEEAVGIVIKVTYEHPQVRQRAFCRFQNTRCTSFFFNKSIQLKMIVVVATPPLDPPP